MARILSRSVGLTVLLGMLFVPQVRAVSIDVFPGPPIRTLPGSYFDSARIRNGGTLILHEAAIGTNAPGGFASVTNNSGGRFVMNSGAIHSFDNSGTMEFYGGSQSTVSSENRGTLILAGGDPGFQLVHFDGTVEVYHLAASRTNWEIDASGSSVIRIHCVTNSLPFGTYTYATLPAGTSIPGGKTYRNHAQTWAPGGNRELATDITILSDWSGSVEIVAYTPPALPALSISRGTFTEVRWGTEADRSYQLEATLDLTAQEWVPFEPPKAGTGGTVTSFDFDSSMPSRVYRVTVRH